MVDAAPVGTNGMGRRARGPQAVPVDDEQQRLVCDRDLRLTQWQKPDRKGGLDGQVKSKKALRLMLVALALPYGQASACLHSADFLILFADL